MAGAFALIMAGFGSAVVGGHVDGSTLSASNYQTISETYTGRRRQRRRRQPRLRSQPRQAGQGPGRADADRTRRPAQGHHRPTPPRWRRTSGSFRSPATTCRPASASAAACGRACTPASTSPAPPDRPSARSPSGTVKSAGYEGAYGNRTIVTLDDGTDIWYCHQSRIVGPCRREGRIPARSSATPARPATSPARTCTSRCTPTAAAPLTRTPCSCSTASVPDVSAGQSFSTGAYRSSSRLTPCDPKSTDAWALSP